MYLPVEGIYYELVCGKTGALLEHAHERRVFPVSPTTFTAYLQVIAFGLKGMEFEQNAHEVMAYLADLRKDFGRFRDDFELVGTHLGRAQTKYVDAEKRLDRFDDKLERASEHEAPAIDAPHSKHSTPPSLRRRGSVGRPGSFTPRSGRAAPRSKVGIDDDSKRRRELIIIGGGPAGYTAALYAARANLSPLVIEGIQWGGQLMITSDVENYPGYPEGVLGPSMMQDFRAQAERFGAEFLTDDVTRVDFSERPFRVSVGDEEHRAQAVIVATGANARQLGLDTEVALQGRGVSYCAVCDAAFFREQDVVVVGGGDSAMEEATFLTKFASKVTLVHRRDEFRASPIMVDRARANEKIEILTPYVVDDVLGEDAGKVTGVILRNADTGETHTVPADGVFVAIGHDPTTALFLDCSTTTTPATS